MAVTRVNQGEIVESTDLSICVLNIQAFNKTTNKIRQEDEYGQNLWEDIKYIKPIVIKSRRTVDSEASSAVISSCIVALPSASIMDSIQFENFLRFQVQDKHNASSFSLISWK